MRSLCSILISLGVLTALAGPVRAEPARPHGTYIPVRSSRATAAQGAIDSRIIYLNGCWHTGDCVITAGYDDSRTQHSSILGVGTANFPPYPWGGASFDQMVQCVRKIYAPFNVQIVTQDPGNKPHWENIVSGTAQDGGFSALAGGVAPFTCNIINDAITYTFAKSFGNDPQRICEVVAQETAHAFGLDHEYLRTDPMTYLTGYHPKMFQDQDAYCGEYTERVCRCGSDTQNSYRSILAVFGPGEPTPPDVAIASPADGGDVNPGFAIHVNASDDTGVASVEIDIDGKSVSTTSSAPYLFYAPADLPQGSHTVVAKASDDFGATGSASITVNEIPPCQGANDCGSGMVCVQGRCVLGPDSAGGLGTACTGSADCASEVCEASSGGSGDSQYCAEPCTIGQGGCPSGFRCEASGSGDVCLPGGGGGCRIAPGADSGSRPLGAGFILLLALCVAGKQRSPRP